MSQARLTRAELRKQKARPELFEKKDEIESSANSIE